MRKVPKLRFKEFNDEWEEKKLGEISEVKDGTHDSPKYVSNGFPLVTSKNVKNGKIDLDEINYISKEDYDNINKRSKVSKGDILMGMIGTIGNLAIVDREDFAIKNVALIKEKNFLKNIFLIQFLQSNIFIKKISLLNEGGTQKFISLGNIRNFDFFIPNLQEQEKIADFLSSIDKKISLTEEKLELFREYKKGVMQKIFSQELRFKDNNGNDYPEWEEKRLEEVTECLDNLRKPLNSNEREKIKGNIPYYGANGIQGYINNYIFNEELVLLAEDGGNFDDYLTKPIAQYVQGKSWINNHAHVLKGKKVLKTKFLYFSLVHKDIRSFINGTSRSKLNKSNMLNIIILLPTVEEQHKIADFLSSIDSKIENIEKELEGLKKFKRGLLQQMFV